jgi:hypothetical protein
MNLFGFAIAAAAQNPIHLTPQLTITKSALVVSASYRIPTNQSLKQPAIQIKGNNITVDFRGAILEGSAPTTEPDARKGLGLSVSGKNITIKNVRVRGYKVGLLARGCSGLKIVDSDFSYNWKQHLASTLDKEDESDWQSYHHNDNDEWLGTYAGAIYLTGCDKFEIRNCKAVDGQCGLMLSRSNHGLVWNNDFSFLSGIGLAMYRSSDNRIMHNNIDWCVRGFSYGVYNRGQDSAGILIYEQSNRNVFAYNSVTHGGDGFFLWAGQTTMDTGQGGCNDNLLYGNDFSHAPTNGIEATFSRNQFVNNLILECWHGIWGGYGFESSVVGNVFGHNAEAIAWEHGQDVTVSYNRFRSDNEGIVIWADPKVDPNWGYAKKRDIRSRDWRIDHNEFRDVFTNAFRVNNTVNLKIDENSLYAVRKLFSASGENPGLEFTNNYIVGGDLSIEGGAKESGNRLLHLDFAPKGSYALEPSSSLNQGNVSDPRAYSERFHTDWNPMARIRMSSEGIEQAKWESARRQAFARFNPPAPLEGGHNPYLKPGTLRGWRYMLVDEWGPYDFKRPLLWPRETLNPGVTGQVTRRRFEILGPRGKWRVAKAEGVAHMSAQSGTVPGFVDVELPVGKAGNTTIDLIFIGGETIDYRGIVTPAGKPVHFGYSKFFAPIDWTVRFYKWTKSVNPSEPHANPDEAALQQIIRGKPLKEQKQDRLDFAGSAFDQVTGNDHFATVANGTFTVTPGDYVLEMTADDGARLWLDGKPLIEDAWHYQGPTLYSRTVHLGTGQHNIRVEHFQIDGYAALKVNLKPKK